MTPCILCPYTQRRFDCWEALTIASHPCCPHWHQPPQTLIVSGELLPLTMHPGMPHCLHLRLIQIRYQYSVETLVAIDHWLGVNYRESSVLIWRRTWRCGYFIAISVIQNHFRHIFRFKRLLPHPPQDLRSRGEVSSVLWAQSWLDHCLLYYRQRILGRVTKDLRGLVQLVIWQPSNIILYFNKLTKTYI